MTFSCIPLGNINLSHRRPAKLGRFWFGTAYYPEHWDAETRKKDAERMSKAGFNVVRMAEFAADLIEPREGEYNFSLFDETIERLGAKNIHTILCTPTATPPRWLSKKHPGILRVNTNGIPMQHGSRQHACHASPEFREYSRNITTVMAKHFKDNPFVIGWQTDNEFFCHFSECHCLNCQKNFVLFLFEKYEGKIDRLNQAWGTAFWAQTYERFEDISTPHRERPARENPSHLLDYYRFLSAGVTLFQHEQIEILRRIQPRWFVTHNGLFHHIDYRGVFTQDLDVLGYDVYPFFTQNPEIRPHDLAFKLDRARAWSGNFIVLEQQSGSGGQSTYCLDTPEPGEMRRMTYTSIARGADSLLHFRWRTCRFGAEEYWAGILDHDNVPRRRYKEAKQEGKEIKVVGHEVLGTRVYVDAAVATSDMNVDDAHETYPLGLPHHNEIAAQIHRALFEQGYAVGCVHPDDDLRDVKLYVIPHWAYWNPDWMPNLKLFVKQGGVLVVGARTATRNTNNTVVAETIPGCFRELAGITVEEYGRQNAPDKRPLYLCMETDTVHTSLWYETLKLEKSTKVLAKWKGRHLTGKPAISIRKFGKGSVVYVGTYLTSDAWTMLMPTLIRRAGLTPLWPDAPKGVEVTLRKDGSKKIWFFINHTDSDITIPRVPKGKNLITQRNAETTITLKQHGVAVIVVK